MLTEMPVGRLSPNERSRRVGLAKANALRHFESREAIQSWICSTPRSRTGSPNSSARTRPVKPPCESAETAWPTSWPSRWPKDRCCATCSAVRARSWNNISAGVGIRHKYAPRQSLQTLVEFTLRHLPELGTEGAAALVESTLLMAMTAWQCSRPSEAMLAAYASDPALAAMRLDSTDLVRRTTPVTASGLPARQAEPSRVGRGCSGR
ncbi:hypothetical protein [Streptomyces sp.]|uniref:hypothetical protein n=1 Tax=Streptomyces sp. TaxID=1931 RepID=UPI003455D186